MTEEKKEGSCCSSQGGGCCWCKKLIVGFVIGALFFVAGMLCAKSMCHSGANFCPFSGSHATK